MQSETIKVKINKKYHKIELIMHHNGRLLALNAPGLTPKEQLRIRTVLFRSNHDRSVSRSA